MASVAENRPRVSVAEAPEIARTLFGLDASAADMASERDRNFRMTSQDGREFVLKIASAADGRAVLELQNEAMAHVAARLFPGSCPVPVPSPGGELIRALEMPGRPSCLVRLVSWVPGRFLGEVRPHSAGLLKSLGRFVGALDRALLEFKHPAADRELVWDIRRADRVIRDHVSSIGDPRRRELASRFLARFEELVLPVAGVLQTSVIHNDGNDWNVLVRNSSRTGADSWELEVAGIIDFGDMMQSWTIADAAIAAAYALLDKVDPLTAIARVVSGYHEAVHLQDAELEAMFPLIGARLATSVCLSAHQQAAEPDNRYLSISEAAAWAALSRLDAIHPRFAAAFLRSACGLEPSSKARLVEKWMRRNSAAAAPVLSCDLSAPQAAVIDLGVEGTEIEPVSTMWSPGAFSARVRERLRESGAEAGIGRYDETRLAYLGDQFIVPRDGVREMRTVHTGIDVFVEPGTPVFAPLDGTVHSLRNNALAFDYGPTIILEHETGTEAGSFWTLYGHLSLDSLEGLTPGTRVRRGQEIARIGAVEVNGGWPPHLHFQVITDMFGREGDYPGVAAPSERELWLSLCPDPGILLGIGDVARKTSRDGAAILNARRRTIGPSLSISYRRPLHIVRGFLQNLYDADGLAYLDAVNNVPHVGHCHPRVVEAVRRQAGLLNTNTRYLHDLLVCYAERLTAKLPPPLSVCFFVNSGSEANDLALRLARAHTGHRDVIVVDGAYHGNLTSLIEISPYKFDGPGGAGAPPHVHKLPVPDSYRGMHRGSEAGTGPRYAAYAEAALRASAEHGGAAAFICESILSCAGQVFLPEGYLPEVYARIRAAGGVCIADEVQVGFGRSGSTFWGFELQGVVPDIVTMGKPIGNGHPLGAVVTTPAIAASFANGMEYFNTYGGNPVSCAVGLAVLDVVEEEQLQAHATTVGRHLLAGLEALRQRHSIIGDVRGSGLFLGIELVLDRETLEPAGTQASYISERMRDHGILVSTDGPWHNVLKIKPPMPFSAADAERFVATLDRILGEDFPRSKGVAH